MKNSLTIMDHFLGPQEIDLDYPCDYICDIDGTLADNSHRQPWVRSQPKNWAAFNKTMADDKPIHHIISAVHILRDNGFNVIFCSGREGTYDIETITTYWLHEHVGLWGPLYMRKERDYRDDGTVKSELLDDILQHGFNPVFALDDRQRVVDMWRSRGMKCIQVDEGDF